MLCYTFAFAFGLFPSDTEPFLLNGLLISSLWICTFLSYYVEKKPFDVFLLEPTRINVTLTQRSLLVFDVKPDWKESLGKNYQQFKK